jgi:hypothetical protein
MGPLAPEALLTLLALNPGKSPLSVDGGESDRDMTGTITHWKAGSTGDAATIPD